jgi:hypothetical protein
MHWGVLCSPRVALILDIGLGSTHRPTAVGLCIERIRFDLSACGACGPLSLHLILLAVRGREGGSRTGCGGGDAAALGVGTPTFEEPHPIAKNQPAV